MVLFENYKFSIQVDGYEVNFTEIKKGVEEIPQH